ncbi:MAG: ribosome small subunit-dependent GTPase A [Candidatus Pristimantibacillus lignocellulolyticus]|uniref:Small ribosomal subunit biogenesis GTPase RsgA n=1 Tax=Candidatus Pristimantibacillus lignocellulolyticus TaxID=2994561 RepID=A0A9J6ZJE2_9BACL|nr:MAG: ribosome small subunit-dependent GTPase A [Candidatus Pristimantibacillus lignocellulolyticus]
MKLEDLGWNPYFENQIAEKNYSRNQLGRVVAEYKHLYKVHSEDGEYLAEVTGKLRHQATNRAMFPAVGDWVVVRELVGESKKLIQEILPRHSKFSRKVAGGVTEEQIVAANVDTLFLVNALNHDFNVRRIERALILAWEGGAQPVIILSKGDLCDDIASKISEVESVALGVPTHVITAIEEDGCEAVRQYIQPGKTIALIGSSGVGKSTLINRILGEEIQRVNEVREGDDRGKHTTTHRQLLLIPEGGIIMDTPGMRELQLWDADDGVTSTFEDVDNLIAQCRFNDCNHNNEPGCAINAALSSGELAQSRYNNYLKMNRELAYINSKASDNLKHVQKSKGKQISMFLKSKNKEIY